MPTGSSGALSSSEQRLTDVRLGVSCQSNHRLHRLCRLPSRRTRKLSRAGGPVLSAAAAPHAAVLDALFQYKIGIVALLRPGRDGWSAEDWQAYFDERAGVAEF